MKISRKIKINLEEKLEGIEIAIGDVFYLLHSKRQALSESIMHFFTFAENKLQIKDLDGGSKMIEKYASRSTVQKKIKSHTCRQLCKKGEVEEKQFLEKDHTGEMCNKVVEGS